MTAVLLSIRPEYAGLILDGVKRVEFRRRPFARQFTHAVIYATSPASSLYGLCEVERVVMDTPEALWSRYGAEGGVPREALFRYLGGVERGVAMVLRSFRPFRDAPDLAALGLSRPPQSFRYLSAAAFADLARYAASPG